MDIYSNTLGSLPLWGVFFITVLIVMISIAIGSKMGKYFHQKRKNIARESASSIVAASLGLLAFMLAFAFGVSASRFDSRKELVIDEVNAIGTAFLRANLLNEKTSSEVQKILREYIDLRVDVTRKGIWNNLEAVQSIVKRSEELQDQLWLYAIDIGKQNPGSETVGLFIESVNEVIDLQTKRLVKVFYYQVPSAIWVSLYLLAVLSFVLLGYEMGISGGGNIVASMILALIFSIVIILITDLERPMEGKIVISQEPYIQLQQKMYATVPNH